MREVVPDYGIDWTVEIFENGEATGRSFNAQVKATDESDLLTALASVRFRRDTAEYYREQSNPVLIVRYHSPTGRLFARWFHAYNPRVARNRLSPDAKTVGFQLFEQDEASDDFAARLRAGLDGFLAFRSSELALPLRVAVTPTAVGVYPEARRMALAMRRILSQVEDLAVIEVREPAPDDPSITIENQRVVISVADVASVTLDRDGPVDNDGPERWAADLTVALAVALTYVGQVNIAAQLGCVAGHLSRIFGDLDIAMTIAGAMLRSQRVREAIQLADALDESAIEDLRFAAFILIAALFSSRRPLQRDEQELALQSAERRIERRRARQDAHGVAAEAYNLAMLHKGTGRAAEANYWFREAAEHDSTYLDRAYYQSDLAGALFESGPYDQAVQHYEVATRIGGRPLDDALLADSLLYAGRYNDALQKFDSYVARRSERSAAEWRLKARIVRLLLEVVGEKQLRDDNAADALLSSWSLEAHQEITPEEAWRSCEEAIALDACCGEAWFRLAMFSTGQAGCAEAGRTQALAAAVLTRHDLAMWSNATLLMDLSDTQLVEDVFYAGYRLNGAEFIETTVRAIDNAPHLAACRDRLINLLDETVAAYQREPSEGIMRVRGEDGQMTEIIVTDSAEDAPRESRPSWRPAPLQLPTPPSGRRTRPRPRRAGKTHGRRKRQRKKRR